MKLPINGTVQETPEIVQKTIRTGWEPVKKALQYEGDSKINEKLEEIRANNIEHFYTDNPNIEVQEDIDFLLQHISDLTYLVHRADHLIQTEGQFLTLVAWKKATSEVKV